MPLDPISMREARDYNPTVVMLEKVLEDKVEALERQVDFLQTLVSRMVEKPPIIQVNP